MKEQRKYCKCKGRMGSVSNVSKRECSKANMKEKEVRLSKRERNKLYECY